MSGTTPTPHAADDITRDAINLLTALLNDREAFSLILRPYRLDRRAELLVATLASLAVQLATEPARTKEELLENLLGMSVDVADIQARMERIVREDEEGDGAEGETA